MTATRRTDLAKAFALATNKGRRLVLPLFLTFALVPAEVFGTSISVTLDTTSLSGTSAQLAFDLVDGDGLINNSVTISDFASDGTLGLSGSTVGVVGILPGTVTISDTEFFNELLQGIILNDSLSFMLDFTKNNAGGPIPDAFSFFILNDLGTSSLITTDLSGDSLLTVDYSGIGAIEVTPADFTNPSLPISVAAVPEPSTLLLLLVAAGGMFVVRRVRPN